MKQSRFVVANLLRGSAEYFARVLQGMGLLDRYMVGTRRTAPGIPAEKTSLLPLIGAINYMGGRFLPSYPGESLRFASVPIFDRWVAKRVPEGCNLLTVVGYLNRTIERVHSWGGKVFIDAGNSHPSNFWSLVAEEHARWGCELPPIWPRHQMRQQRTAQLADHFIAPSKFVANSYLDRGYAPERVSILPYPVDLSFFTEKTQGRERGRPLTMISSGNVNLRKGAPYLLQAFEIIRRKIPDARLLFCGGVSDSMAGLLKTEFRHTGAEFLGGIPQARLVEELHRADLFVFPTIEEGCSRSVLEALACGLPVITTPHAGANDFIVEGESGSVVPIRDPGAVAEAVFAWWDRVNAPDYRHGSTGAIRDRLTPSAYARGFAEILEKTVGIQRKD